MEHYTAVVYATGAQTDKSLGIPGEDLPGSWAATEFVAWYNGHPDYRDLEFDLSARARGGDRQRQRRRRRRRASSRAAPTSSSAPTSPTTRSRRCARAAIEEVVVLGRRGPAQAAFTSAELRELGHLDGVDLRVDPAEVELDPVSRAVARRGGHLHRAQERRAAAGVRRRGPARPAPRGGSSCASCARRSRSAATGRVEAIDVAPQRDRPRRRRRAARRAPTASRRDDRVRPRAALGRLPRGAAARRALRRAPLRAPQRARPRADARRRAAARASTPSAGSSAARPASSARTSATPRRPSAASPRTCAAGALPQPAEPAREQIDALLAERTPDLVTADGWRAIDARELERGRAAERPRVKLASRDELLAAAG